MLQYTVNLIEEVRFGRLLLKLTNISDQPLNILPRLAHITFLLHSLLIQILVKHLVSLNQLLLCLISSFVSCLQFFLQDTGLKPILVQFAFGLHQMFPRCLILLFKEVFLVFCGRLSLTVRFLAYTSIRWSWAYVVRDWSLSRRWRFILVYLLPLVDRHYLMGLWIEKFTVRNVTCINIRSTSRTL